MKLVSWNVNGLRAVIGKDFYASVAQMDPDVLCLQEIKMQKGQCTVDMPGYEAHFCCADKKGYSGTAVFSRGTDPECVLRHRRRSARPRGARDHAVTWARSIWCAAIRPIRRTGFGGWITA